MLRRDEPSEKRSARLRRIRADRPGWSTAKNAKWNLANPEKRRAHKKLEYAVRVGRVARRCCERCGSDKAQAHHDDYSRPLEVMWLCQPHHRERHRELEGIPSAQGNVAAHVLESSPKLAAVRGD